MSSLEEKKRVERFILCDKVSETNGAYLYMAQNSKDEADKEDFFYVVKEYNNEKISVGTLEREKKISHEIENYAGKSIVIPILEILKEEEKEYALMQFRRNGKFLSEIIKELELKHGKGNIPVEVALEIVREILASLEVMHSFEKEGEQVGYLHLDLHPGNIFFESVDLEKKEIGKVKFIDFFSAVKLENGKVVLDKNEKISIDTIYSSPEQRMGDDYKYRPATDLFSVGAIFLRLISGKTDFEEKNLKNLHKNSVMKQVIQRFLECSMEQSPKYRYESADKMKCAVEKLKRCNEAYEEKDYYTLFSIAYEMAISEEEIEDYDEEIKEGTFHNAVINLEADLKQDIINISKCKYLFKMLWNYAQKKELRGDIKYKLINSGIACGNHTGDSLQVKTLYEEIEKIKDKIPLMDYFVCLNRAAVMYADRYEYEKAYDVIEKNIESLETIKKVYEEVAEKNGMLSLEEPSRILDLARSYSAKGSYIVWTQKGDPMPVFEKALTEFGDNIGNKIITMAHILQYAIEIQDKQLYEQYSKSYFKETGSITKCLKQILSEDKLDVYRLLVLLKGIYTFYIENVDLESQKEISGLINNSTLRSNREHPVQLIYKYVGLILYKSADFVTDEAEEAFLISMTCVKQGEINLNYPINIMMCMTYQTMWLYNELTGQEEENKELLEIMIEHCKESEWKELEQELENKGSIKNVLKYEHC